VRNAVKFAEKKQKGRGKNEKLSFKTKIKIENKNNIAFNFLCKFLIKRASKYLLDNWVALYILVPRLSLMFLGKKTMEEKYDI
jgi:hypothetical protein